MGNLEHIHFLLSLALRHGEITNAEALRSS